MKDLLKRAAWFEIGLTLIIMSVHLYAATSDAFNFPANWFTRDDAYYYFKVAGNISQGLGSTFDGVNPTNGYHPLWTLVCIPIFALARFDLILPLRLLLLVQGGLSAATAILIYRMVRATLSHPLAVLAGTWWAFDIYIHYSMYEFGLETGLASYTVTLLVYNLWKFEREWRTTPPSPARVAGLAALAVLALLSRLDLIFLAGLAGLWIILRGQAMRHLLPLDAALAVVTVLAGFVIRLDLPAYYTYSGAALAMIACSLIFKLPLYYFLGLYQPATARPIRTTLLSIVLAVSAASLLTGAVMLLIAEQVGSFPRVTLMYDWAFSLAGISLLRMLGRYFSQSLPKAVPSPMQCLKDNWQTWLREGIGYYSVLGGALAVYMLLNKILIGSSMPVSGQIKRWWGEFGSRVYGGSARNWVAFWGVDFETDFNIWRPLSMWIDAGSRSIARFQGIYKTDNIYLTLWVILIILWVGALAINRRRAIRAMAQFNLPLLLGASIIQFLSYNMTGYSALKEWYWITQPLFLVLAFALALDILIKKLIPQGKARLMMQWSVTAALCVPLIWVFTVLLVERMPHGLYPPDRPYMDSAIFLEEHTPPGALIGMTGGGNVGYYIRGRTIVNMDGLINSPAYFEALKNGRAGEYLYNIGLDYIFANPGMLEATPYRGQFHTGETIERFGGKALMELLP